MRRRGRQVEQSGEVPDQISTGLQNPVLEELDPATGFIGGLVVDNSVG